MKRFSDWSEAFDFCREANKPIVVFIEGNGEFKLYPSGKAVRRTTAAPDRARRDILREQAKTRQLIEEARSFG